jgi:hypothetical protein
MTTMTEPTTHTLDAPGAVLTYTTSGIPVPARPLSCS